MTNSPRKTPQPARSDEQVQHTVLPSVDHEPMHPDRVAELAYHRYEQRGCEHGRDMDDWLEAERELQRANERPND